MQLSTRNQLKGKITDVQPGGIMAEVTVEVSGQTVVAAITRDSRPIDLHQRARANAKFDTIFWLVCRNRRSRHEVN